MPSWTGRLKWSAASASGTLLDGQAKISDAVLGDLGGDRLLGFADRQASGGSGSPFASFAAFLTRMAMVDRDHRRAGLGPAAASARSTAVGGPSAIAEQNSASCPLGQRENFRPSPLHRAWSRSRPDGATHPQSWPATISWSTARSCSLPMWCRDARICLVVCRAPPAVLIVALPEATKRTFSTDEIRASRRSSTRTTVASCFAIFRVPAANFSNCIPPPPKRKEGGARRLGLTISYHGLKPGVAAYRCGAMRRA